MSDMHDLQLATNAVMLVDAKDTPLDLSALPKLVTIQGRGGGGEGKGARGEEVREGLSMQSGSGFQKPYATLMLVCSTKVWKPPDHR